MKKDNYFDLERRDGKANSTFCGYFQKQGMPYVFANLNETYEDIVSFIHEFGHSIQMWMSRNQPIVEYFQAGNEAGELPSKGLEYLTYDFIASVLAPGEADRYRRTHMRGAIGSQPMVMLMDHFQHDLYSNPSASAADRNEMWLRREKDYMPRLDYGDLAYPAQGTRYLNMRHIFNSPFYNIDYMMADGGALELMLQSRVDQPETMARYKALCARGGEAPSLELFRDAGLSNPLNPGLWADILPKVEKDLGLSTPAAHVRNLLPLTQSGPFRRFDS